jgi:Domain of unknown function (DUF305)
MSGQRPWLGWCLMAASRFAAAAGDPVRGATVFDMMNMQSANEFLSKAPPASPRRLPVRRLALLLTATMALSSGPGYAQDVHQHRAPSNDPAPAPFVANTGKPFAQLMDDAMTVMDHGMRTAPMNGIPEHDFVTMMIPHHQGAIDMARALLLSTKDPELRNLAQGIITEQENEIRLMRAWLQRHGERKR